MEKKDGNSKMKQFKNLFVVLIAAACCSSIADSFSVELENDTFTLPKKDSEYSHGTELTYMRDESLWIFDSWGMQVQQNMYGPKLIKTDDLQVGEHPYCGYLSFNFIGEQWFDLGWADLSLQHKVGLGGVGPHSYAKESQKTIHKWLGCKDPKGWDKWQIKDEFIVQYEGWANFNTKLIDAGWFQLYGIPRLGIDVGGFKDMLAAGFDIRFGLNPIEEVGHGMILSAPARRTNSDYSLYLLAGLEGRCVFHDTSIDGGFFRKSIYENESETWVGELHFGAGFKIKDFEFEYEVFKRTKEFKTEERAPSYGRIAIKWNF